MKIIINQRSYIICLIQYFEADFPWKVSLKVLNSGVFPENFHPLSSHFINMHVVGLLSVFFFCIKYNCFLQQFILHTLTLVLLNPDLSFFENDVDSDQLVSVEAICSGSTTFSTRIENTCLQLEC